MTLPPRLDPCHWRAALWALRAKARSRNKIDISGSSSLSLPRVPVLPDRARHAVLAVLFRTRATCLERATVLQAWDLAHEYGRDIIIGVTKPSEGFRAHAWLDGDDACHSQGFTELLRLPPRGIAPVRRR